MLATILSRLTDSAVTKPTHPFAHRLTNGLRITIIFLEQSNSFNLVLARDKVFPSLIEWNTVLKNWPYPTKAKPRSGNVDHRYSLSAMFPAHPKLF
jgi:hypothetical protein